MNKFFTHIFIAIAAILLTFKLTAQNKQLKLADFQTPAVYPEYLSNLQWLDNDTYVYVANNALIKGRATKNIRDTVLKLTDLNTMVIKNGGNEMKRFPRIRVGKEGSFTFIFQNTLYRYFITSKTGLKLNSYPEDAENIDIDYVTGKIAYTKGANIFVMNQGIETQITFDDKEGVVNGTTVHRNEFGISKGLFWSPTGQKLAFYNMDESMVTEYPIVDIDHRIAEANPIRYPMAGMTSHQVKIGVYNFNTEKTVFLKPKGDVEQYLTNVTWAPSEHHIFVAIVNRAQNHMDLCQFDAESGNLISNIFYEEDPCYVEPQQGVIFLPNSQTQFLWQSKRHGFNHLYLYETNGQMIREITQGSWDVTDFNGFDAKGEKLFFTATKESPLQRHIYSYDMKKGVIEKLTNEHGTHTAIMNQSGTLFLDIFSSTDVPYCAKIMTAAGKKSIECQTLLLSENPFKDYTLGEMTIDKIKSDNGVDLYYRLIKPVGFNPNEKYPVFVYVYGGPHAQLITDSWLGGNDLFLFYMAQQGYVVFTLDNQGSDGRGHKFESIIHRKLGQQECKDQMAGINFLKQFPWVDQNRIGIDGWSYGGFMTINMLLTYPGVFKAGCAGGPVCDWKYYEIMYGERYMDKPDENPDGYAKSNLIDRAYQLKDNLLIIHGTSDNVVVWQHSLSFIKACIDNGIQVDYFVYPEHEHNVRGKDRIHLYEKISNYFDLHLKN